MTSPAQGSGVRLVQVTDAHDGQRIDNFLLGQLKGVPKSLIYRILRTGQVRLNGKRTKPDARIADGDEVRIPPVRTAEPAAHGAPAPAQLERMVQAIVYEDRDFLVLDKPSGVASHGGSGISFGAIELLRAARPRDTLELAHRLDRDTSGVLVLTRRRSALTALQNLIRDNETTKQYLTLMQGRFRRATFDVNVALRKSVLQGGERMVRVDEAGKAALTRFRAIETFRDATLAEVTLFTGRTHQIRVHSAHSGHPIAGDEKYGNRDFNLRMREFGLHRLFLHAARFEFALGDRTYSFSAPLAAELRAVLNALPRTTGNSAR
ncbi:MAG TPA: RluA family pseudouridine synthase [Rudaea sp.]|nr:RluA family pseudouridine synthase [Rudaea sp.]